MDIETPHKWLVLHYLVLHVHRWAIMVRGRSLIPEVVGSTNQGILVSLLFWSAKNPKIDIDATYKCHLFKSTDTFQWQPIIPDIATSLVVSTG